MTNQEKFIEEKAEEIFNKIKQEELQEAIEERERLLDGAKDDVICLDCKKVELLCERHWSWIVKSRLDVIEIALKEGIQKGREDKTNTEYQRGERYLKEIQELEKELKDAELEREKIEKPEIIEALAELEHEQWIKWSQTIIDKALNDSLSSTDASKVRNNVLAMHQRWLPLWIHYSELTEEMKEHDRVWARKVIEKLKEGK